MSAHACIVGLKELGRVDPRPRPLVWWATCKALTVMQEVCGGVKVVMEEPPRLKEPVLFAMNHSHYFDFMPSRAALWRQLGVQTASFVKARAFQNRLEGAYIKSMGNIPLVSRGYLISADFANLHGRAPNEEEYRHLREHVDHDAPLPESTVYWALRGAARCMLDVDYDPQRESYREAIEVRYTMAMARSVALGREAVAAGQSLHIYPQGLYSTRLSHGRIGAAQFALALDLPIVPVGLSGMNEHFPPRKMIPHRRGALSMRFGAPRRMKSPEFEGFRPFDSREEERLRAPLQRETQALMDRINALLDPAYQWGEDREGDGLVGVARFFE